MQQPADRESVRIGQIEIRYIEDGVASGGATGMFELIVQPGARVPPPHSHSGNEEIVYVLEGVLRYAVDDDVRDLKPGDHMRTPCGSVHSFSNPHPQTARALVTLTPDIGAQYFRDIAALATGPGAPDPVRMAQTMARYGLVVSKPV